MASAERVLPGGHLPKLSKADLARHRAAYVSAVNAAMGAADFFCQRGVEVLVASKVPSGGIDGECARENGEAPAISEQSLSRDRGQSNHGRH